jgi:hypothetical protein
MGATTAKKVRTTDPITGKFHWVDPQELEIANPRARAVADLSAGELLDWDGNAVEQPDETYDEYVHRMPSKDDLKRFRQPVFHWEVRYPGCILQPFPRMGAITSTPSGLWQSNNAVQLRAVHEHIRITARVDPDLLRISDDEMAVMNGQKDGVIRYCQNAGCFFVSCSMTAIDLHESLCGHRTDRKPRST